MKTRRQLPIFPAAFFAILATIGTLLVAGQEVPPAPAPVPAAPASTEAKNEAPKESAKPAEPVDGKKTEAADSPPAATEAAKPLPKMQDFVLPPRIKPPATKTGEYTGKVVVIPIGEEDLISPARFEYMSRTMKRATDEGAEAVVFDLDTPGGLAWHTTTVVMKDLQELTPRSVAFVNPRALSAGAIIAMATDAVYMSPASSIGAATPVSGGGEKMDDAERAKMNSAFMAMARTAVKSKGHNPEIIEAMIDKDVGLKVSGVEICPKGRILTLDQQEATKTYDGKPLLAKAIVRNLDELVKQEGFKGPIIKAEPKGFELVAILITKYAAILLLVGIAGGYLEMQHPGFGIPGIISATAFGLFFFGHYVAGSLVGYETVFIFFIGVLFLIVELFVFPGHLMFGLVGLVLVIGSIIYTMSGWDVNVPEGGTFPVRFEDYVVALRNLGLAFTGALALIIIFMRYFPSAGPFQRLILQAAVGGEQDSIEGHGQSRASTVPVGASGTTRSAMRPYGHVDFGETTIEAMVEGDYIAPGTPVKVKSVTGTRIIVQKA
ncbi:NfeD family protein [Verrucomicrobium sp. BvORR106]|uniref:NfeD family protein n=1 Tax=Verrucomicrobium sp. BvORR106 TaxID=1403819 RepID=UPI00057133EE|nr:NfeD family protein [Verrucomicrobium sp. BvORR106]